jgi:helicase
MRTTEYAWYRPPFEEYNIAQRAVIPYCDQDVNMVVCFGTAVGKTVIAECCFGYHLNRDGCVAYVAPYRSLCSEKYDQWSNDIHFERAGVAIKTGERQSRNLEEAGLTVMTCESFDVRTRSQGKWREWIEKLDCVVFDEAHMIGDKSRGASLEASMMRLTAINPKCRLLLLSATMDNAIELAKWVKSLNGKNTKCFTSDWRPNQVDMIEMPVDGWDGMMDQAVNLASKKEGKTIVFVHSKRVGADIAKRLRKEKIATAFHNASVQKRKREKIEKLFNDPNSGMDTLVSTSTLGAGVNIG